MGVYKEGKNWKVQVYYKDWKGNRKRKQKRGFRTKGEAKEWERDFLQQQSQGVDIEFGNFLEIYYKDMDVRLRESTMSMKRYIIELKIRPYFEKKVLSEITVADIRAWQNELLSYKDKNGKGYAPTYLKTINCQLTAILTMQSAIITCLVIHVRKPEQSVRVKGNQRTSGCRMSSTSF